jgi:hypothetical protein
MLIIKKKQLEANQVGMGDEEKNAYSDQAKEDFFLKLKITPLPRKEA